MHRTRNPHTQPTLTPHPPPFYIFKAPNGVTFPAAHFCRRSAFQRSRSPFQRSIFIARRLSSEAGPLSSTPFSSHIGFPAKQATFPAAHFHRTSAFQRHGPPFQRPMFIARRLSSDTGHLSSGPFSSHICRLASSIIRNWLASHYLIVS